MTPHSLGESCDTSFPGLLLANRVTPHSLRLRGKKDDPPNYEEFFAVCKAVNETLENETGASRCPRCDAESMTFELIRPFFCTLDTLNDIGGDWAQSGREAVTEALRGGCAELAKLTPRRKICPQFLAVGPAETTACAPDTLAGVVAEELAERATCKDDIAREIKDLEDKEPELIAELAHLEADFARASAEERVRLATQRLETQASIEANRAAIAKKKADRGKLLPDFLTGFAQWLDTKRTQELWAVCRKYNHPDRSDQLVLSGDTQTCDTVRIGKALDAIEDRPARERLRLASVRTLPVAVWFLTFSAGASNQDFEYVDVESIAGAETFAEVKDKLQEESELSTSIGVSWSTQIGGQFFSFGYERRNKYKSGSATEICTPIEAGGATERCVETNAGVPKKIGSPA